MKFTLDSLLNLQFGYLQEREVFPSIGKNPKITYTRADDRRYDFKREIKEITFTGKEYLYFLAIETGDFRCTEHILNVYNDCPPLPDDLKFTGKFSSSDGAWDLDKCTVKFKVKEFDQYTCLDEDDEKINIFDFSINTVSLNMGISFKYQYDTEENSGGRYTYTNFNILINTPIDFIAPSGWVFQGDTIPGVLTYRRWLFDKEEYISSVRLANNEGFSNIDNAFPLKDLINSLMYASCSNDLTLKSDFFQWNLEFPDPYFYDKKYNNLFLVQKSDVKRPNALNNAIKGELNPLELIEALCNIFNLGYNISNGVLRIEHISFFESLGVDLTKNKRHEFLLKGTKKYRYDSNKLPKYEKFKMMEAGSVDFIGKDIIYNNSCVNNDEENKSEINVDFITTDVMYCLENQDSNNDNVSDDGFVLIACDFNNKIVYEPGILLGAGTPLNNTLSWAHLHRDLWMHGRVLKEGMMNGVLTEFTSTIPNIKQDKFSVIIDCTEIRSFKPLDLMKATLGWGSIQTAELGLMDCSLSIEMNLREITQAQVSDENYGDFDANFDNDFD